MKHSVLLLALLLGAGPLYPQDHFLATSSYEVSSGRDATLGGLSFTEENLSFSNGDVSLAGTLAIPDNDGPHPAVVLLSMGGSQTRDSESGDFKLFKVLSDHLVLSGIAVLRFDDRGVGKSTGNLDESTLSDLAADALAAVSALKQRPDIMPREIGVLGHSQGGIVAPLAASRSNDIAFVVLMGAPMLSAAQMMAEAQNRILLSRNVSAEQLNRARTLQESLFAAMRGVSKWEEVEQSIATQIRAALKQVSPEQMAQIGDVDAFVKRRTNEQTAPLKTALLGSLLDHSPADILASLSVPVLTISGGLDTQVPLSVHGPATQKALAEAGVESTTQFFPSANHQFQTAITGDPTEYPSLENLFVPGFLELNAHWINYQTASGSTSSR